MIQWHCKIKSAKVPVITDPQKVDAVLDRGVEIIYPDRDTLRKKLLSGERIKLYCGFDPSAPALHIGNAIALCKLSQFQDLGHEVIFLIGEFTGTIGDPTDKSSARVKLTREQVTQNAAEFQKQAGGYLKFDGENPARVVRNSEWLDKITFQDLIELSAHFTVQQLIQRDMFQKRLAENKPIYLHEFLYPLAQGYDSVALDVDLEVGGNDQMFNMMAGRDLMKALGMREKCVLTMKLLADDSGKKMGKSEGNAVFLDQTPEDMYGKVMSWQDGVIVRGFELATKVPMDEVEQIKQGLASGQNPRDAKMKLAWELVKINHGDDAADKAQAHFQQVFAQKELPDEMKNIKPAQISMNIVDLVSMAGGNIGRDISKSEARRLIQQGAVKYGGQVINSIEAQVRTNGGFVLQIGKRGFVKVG